MRLHGRVVWVTGSARRVGREIALGLADEGADVVVHCNKSRGEAEMVADLIRRKKRHAWIVQGDQSSREDVVRMAEEVRGAAGRLHGLVNCAAIFPRIRIEDVTEEDFENVLRTNLMGPFFCAQACLPLLREAKPGHIVNITDWSVERPYKNYAAYMASKGGLKTLTRAMARELAPDVLVNAVAPGPVIEPEEMSDSERASILEKLPLGKWGNPQSVAKAVAFLLENDNITGETITVDGGRSLA